MLALQLSDFSLAKNRLYRLRDRFLAQGRPIIDLISADPTRWGLNFPREVLAQAEADYLNRFEFYQPDPKGWREARMAVCDYYGRRNWTLTPEEIVLTPGTSESYFYLFKLLAKPFQEILCPQPSYPLFDYIAQVSDVSLRYYELDEANHWSIDFDSLTSAISAKTAALVIVSPHNPTGHVCSSEEGERLRELALKFRLPIIVDEVFHEFIFSADDHRVSTFDQFPLIFVLNGVSKMFALPQLKLGWIVVAVADDQAVAQASDRLETVADTFLSTSDLSQHALPTIFLEGQTFLETYRSEVHRRLDLAARLLGESKNWDFSFPEGGFYLILRPRRRGSFNAENFALELLTKKQVLLHPSSFYDFPAADALILSFLSGDPNLTEGLRRLEETIDGG